MLTVNSFWIIVLIIFVVGFLVELFFIFLLSHIDKIKYSLFRNCPSELIDGFPHGYLFKYVNLISSLISISFIALIVVYKEEFGDLYILTILIASFISLTNLLSISLVNISIFYTKQHSIISSIYMALSFFVTLMVSFYSFYLSSLYMRYSTGSAYHLSLGIISSLFSVLSLIILFNPKLKNWAKLDKIKSNDEVIYTRPKYFPLAYSEWVMIALSFVSGIIFLLSLLNL